MTTGAASISANLISSSIAPALATPLPATISGRLALRKQFGGFRQRFGIGADARRDARAFGEGFSTLIDSPSKLLGSAR